MEGNLSYEGGCVKYIIALTSACSGRARAALAVEWLVSASEVVQVLCGWRAVARR